MIDMGIYSIKSGYKLFVQLNQKGPVSNDDCQRRWWKILWSLKIPNKIKFFVWRSYHNIIPTIVNLSRCHVETEAMCPLCQKDPETTDHALFKCKIAKKVWAIIASNMQLEF